MSGGLAATQERFLARLLHDDAPQGTREGAQRALGMDVYRNAYRSRLVDALRQSYPRTARLAGETAFRQAAAHHLIEHPPSSWTLDHAGAGFAQTCAMLFTQDTDVAEVAALEWAMGQAFIAANACPLNLTSFSNATADFSEQDWETFGLDLLPGTALLPATVDLVLLWRDLAQDGPDTPRREPLDGPRTALVWREDEQPVFILISLNEAQTLGLMMAGKSFGMACAALSSLLGEEEAARQAGAMLGRWVNLGLVGAVRRLARIGG